jgi:hypothetical protein
MAKTDITRQKIKSKISAIKKISDNPKSLVDTSYDAYKDLLGSTNGIVKKNINDFTSKVKGTTENVKDIFGEITDLAEGFLGTQKEDPTNPRTKPLVKTKILKYSKQSTTNTLKVTKQIINDEVKKSLFEGVGLCDSNKTIGTTSLNLSPSSFDFVNMLKVDPTSISGKLMYENTIDNGTGDIKFNKQLYTQFDSGSPFSFTSKDGTTLFTLAWNSGTQNYNITNLPSTMNMGDFLSSYYNSIEYPDVENIFQNAMMMTLQGDGTEPSSFKDGMKYMNRICTKLLSVCGSPANNQPLLNNTPQQLTEDETDVQNYFDFDDVEGIDLDNEDSAFRRVLKFRDCNNFESPVNTNNIEDFTYLSGTKNLDENIMNTLNKAAMDAFEQSGSNIPFDGFQLSLTGSYISKIPRAIISSALSPKMFFPIALVYKDLKGTDISAKDLMKVMANLFFNVVKAIFWRFIKEFWNFIKRDILLFVKDTAAKILDNQLKKIKGIISMLIQIITRVMQIGIGSCSDIFNAMLNAITSALNKRINIPIPGLLLALSDRTLPGYSSDRAYMNIMERMEAAGVNTQPLYGTENKLTSVIKSIMDGHAEEMDTNSYVKVALHTTTIPSNGTNSYIIEGLVTAGGKLF